MKAKWIWFGLTHGTLVLSIVFLVFFCIDRVNPMMEFIGSDLSDWLLMVFCCFALLSSIFSAVRLFKDRSAEIKESRENKNS